MALLIISLCYRRPVYNLSWVLGAFLLNVVSLKSLLCQHFTTQFSIIFCHKKCSKLSAPKLHGLGAKTIVKLKTILRGAFLCLQFGVVFFGAITELAKTPKLGV